MKKLLVFILVCACILPRLVTVHVTVNNHINVRHKNDKSG